MKRRSFLTLLGGAAAAWPLAARAQQVSLPVIGWLNGQSFVEYEPFLIAFRQGLAETGFIEHRNIGIDYRWAQGQYERLPRYASEMVRRPVAVIVATGTTAAALAAKAATTIIPIVFVSGGNPVELGIVSSFNRPGGNVTGVSFAANELGAKRLELLHGMVPHATKVGFLVNQRERLLRLAAQYRIPAIYYATEFTKAGGLMSYTGSFAATYRQAGLHAGRVLKGEKPADLPVVQTTKFEFVINLSTARVLGIEVPPTLSALADEIIE